MAIELLKGAPNNYEAEILKAAEMHKVPAELMRRIIKQESGGNPNAVSPMGAKGVAGFMPGTAARYGVDVTNPASSIDGMARYLNDMHNKLGTWEKSAAGYNWGENRAAFNSPDWKSKLPAETKGYLASIMPGEFDIANPAAAPVVPPLAAPVASPVGDAPPAPATESPEQQKAKLDNAMEAWKKQQEYLGSQEKPPGYGAMSHMKAGFAGMSNPGFQDMSGYAESNITNLMQLLMSGKMGGQEAYTPFMGGRNGR